MPKKVPPLTDPKVSKTKPRDKVRSLPDGDGLSLMIHPNGSRIWNFKYTKPFTTSRTNISFGAYPDVSLEAAREKRAEARSLLSEGIDPKKHRDERHRASVDAHQNTLRSVTDIWMLKKRKMVSEDYANDIYRSFELHLFSRLGNVPVHLIMPRDAVEALQPLADLGKLETLKRVCQRLNEVMDHAVNIGKLDFNNLTRISKAFPPPKTKNFPALAPSELPELMEAVADANVEVLTRLLIEWQLHTMVRPSEAAGARWDEIDEEAKVWVIADPRMKKKRLHRVPLTTVTMRLLQRIKKWSRHSEFLFHGARSQKVPRNPETVNKALRRNGFKGRCVSHGLRSIASTALHEQGFQSKHIEVALSHLDRNRTRAAYNRTDYLDQRRPIMEWWSNFIEQCKHNNNKSEPDEQYQEAELEGVHDA